MYTMKGITVVMALANVLHPISVQGAIETRNGDGTYKVVYFVSTIIEKI